MRLQKLFLSWVAGSLFSIPVMAVAITVLEPNGSGNEKIAEGVEFSAYVKGNRWDMSDPADVITSESKFLSNESFSNGVYSATSVEVGGTTDPKFYLTYPGLPSAVFSIESGQMYPIDTSVYRKLSIKIRHLGSNGLPTNSLHAVQVFFFKDENSIRDKTFGNTLSAHVMSDGDWHIVQIDLIDDLSPRSDHSWTEFSHVKGLRIDPTGIADTRIEVDWVRLTAPGDVGTEFDVQWSGGQGPYSISARKQNDVSALMATNVTGNSANVDFSTLPAGDYTIEVSDQQEVGSSASTLQINEAPIFNFLQPDIRGDVAKRYSFVEAGNPWGPMDAGDIASSKQLTAINYTNPSGSFTATSTGSDSQVFFNTPAPIDTTRYRMLSYTLSVSGARDVGLGSVARVFWGQVQGQLTTSEDIIVQEGLNTYELGDMRDMRIEGGPANQWLGSLVVFRIDPTEFSTAKNIRIDNVTLAPFDVAEPTFDISWLDSDADDNASIKLFADVDKIPGNGNEILIGSGILEDAGDNSFLWTAADPITTGEYNLYSGIDDGFNKTTRYATGPILVIPGTLPDPDISFRNSFED